MNNQFNFQDVVELYLMSALILEDDSTDGSSYVQHLGLSIPLLNKEGISSIISGSRIHEWEGLGVYNFLVTVKTSW